MANSHYDGIQALVHKINEGMLVDAIGGNAACSTISPSAYDTACVAMISDDDRNNDRPMFGCCLEWILNNQRLGGFWGEIDSRGNPTIDSLPATLACMVALKRWSLGNEHIERGMTFINTNSMKLLQLEDNRTKFPRWFAIAFPGMVELARRTDLHIRFEKEVKEAVACVFHQQQEILNMEELVDRLHYPPLLSFLEVLPHNLVVDHATILGNLNVNGSLFRSPSATAAAFMATRNRQTLSYLYNLVRSCNNGGGVPSIYPIDKDNIKICTVNQLQRLGLSKHFSHLMNDTLEQIYKEYNAQGPSKLRCLTPSNIYKSSLSFQLLRLHGYKVTARGFCWFLDDEYALKHIEENYEKFATALYTLYRATNLMFESEVELQELRSFSRKLLAKSSRSQNIDDGIMLWSHLQHQIKSELDAPWLARMDHLENRKWIDSIINDNPLWLGKSSFFRISYLDDEDLLQLAKDDYELRQRIYQEELEILIRWSKINGLMDMGFAREKTTYCYFAVASATSLPYDSYVRLIVAKSAVLVTIFDDYFDMEGSLDELQILADAVQRWNNKGLKSHSKILFDALANVVSDLAKTYFDQYGIDISDNIRKIWYEVVSSWLTEATWSKTGQIPSMNAYLETGMISIAAHLLVLHASCFLIPALPPHKLNPSKYDQITQQLMLSCRLLNDLQSYEKEVKDGKINSVHLYMKENPEANIEEAIRYVKNILEETKMKLLELALIDGNDNEELPKPCKMLHLTALKVFHMFFNSSNHFDSKDSLVNEINKAIFIPLETHRNCFNPKPPTLDPQQKKSRSKIINSYNNSIKYHGSWKPNHQIYSIISSDISFKSRRIPLKVYSSSFSLFIAH